MGIHFSTTLQARAGKWLSVCCQDGHSWLLAKCRLIRKGRINHCLIRLSFNTATWQGQAHPPAQCAPCSCKDLLSFDQWVSLSGWLESWAAFYSAGCSSSPVAAVRQQHLRSACGLQLRQPNPSAGELQCACVCVHEILICEDVYSLVLASALVRLIRSTGLCLKHLILSLQTAGNCKTHFDVVDDDDDDDVMDAVGWERISSQSKYNNSTEILLYYLMHYFNL